MVDYKQISRDGEGEIVIKGSRFICHLKRVANEDEAVSFIQHIKKIHKKATHNVSAYVIGEQDHIQRAHDDGEPSGTAGVPVLEVLKKNELHFIAAVVTRYFGGTKLGAGGLIRAYGSSVSHTLRELGVIMHTQQTTVKVTLPYHLSGKFDYFITNSPFCLLHTEYMDKVFYFCGVLSKELSSFYQLVGEQFNPHVLLENVDEQYVDLPIDIND